MTKRLQMVGEAMVVREWVCIVGHGGRGYYRPRPRQPDGFVLAADCAAALIQREELAKLRNLVRRYLRRAGYGVRTGFLPSSNAASANFYVLTRPTLPGAARRRFDNLVIGTIADTLDINSADLRPMELDRFEERLARLLRGRGRGNRERLAAANK